MNKKIIGGVLLSAFFLLPFVAFADPGPGIDFSAPQPTATIINVPNFINSIITWVWWFFLGFAVISFILAGIQFLNSHGEPAKVTQARNFVLWGIVGVAVAVIGFSVTRTVTSLLIPAPAEPAPAVEGEAAD